jgi:hypothetical protein
VRVIDEPPGTGGQPADITPDPMPSQTPPPRKPSRGPKRSLLGPLVALVFVGITLTFAGSASLRDWRLETSGRTVSAHVVNKDGGGDIPWRIEAKFVVADRPYDVWITLGSAPPPNVGRDALVQYDPADPSSARVAGDRDWPSLIFTAAALATTALMVGWGIGVVFPRRLRSDKP